MLNINMQQFLIISKEKYHDAWRTHICSWSQINQVWTKFWATPPPPSKTWVPRKKTSAFSSHEHEAIHQDLMVLSSTWCIFCKVWILSSSGWEDVASRIHAHKLVNAVCLQHRGKTHRRWKGRERWEKWADPILFHLSLLFFPHDCQCLAALFDHQEKQFLFLFECVLELTDDKKDVWTFSRGTAEFCIHRSAIVPGIAAQQGGKDAALQWWAKSFNEPNITESLKISVFYLSPAL